MEKSQSDHHQGLTALEIWTCLIWAVLYCSYVAWSCTQCHHFVNVLQPKLWIKRLMIQMSQEISDSPLKTSSCNTDWQFNILSAVQSLPPSPLNHWKDSFCQWYSKMYLLCVICKCFSGICCLISCLAPSGNWLFQSASGAGRDGPISGACPGSHHEGCPGPPKRSP